MEDLPPIPTGAPASPSSADAWRKRFPDAPPPAADGSGAQRPKQEDAPPVEGDSARKIDGLLALQEIENLKQNRDLRKKYADKAYSLACGCLAGWGTMLIATGAVNGARGQALWSDQVIIAVTTGVTVSVLAAFLGVIRGLFPADAARK